MCVCVWFVLALGHKVDTSINPTYSLDSHTQCFGVGRDELRQMCIYAESTEWTGVCDASSHVDLPSILASFPLPVFLLKSALAFASDTRVSRQDDGPAGSCRFTLSAALILTL